MRVIFVDDDPRLLGGLEMMLFEQAADWDMHFFQSGHDALAFMETTAVDVIVSDMRMPGMSGEMLLRNVSERHPEVVRIVLSGQVDVDTAERTLTMVHDFLSKPCDAGTMIATVTRALALARSERPGALRKAVGATTRLPSRPNTYMRIRQTMSHPDFGLDDLVDVLGTDIAMSATVLHLANSAYFARGSKASNLCEAVRRLGADVIAGATLTAESLGAFDLPDVNVDELNQHALHAVAAVRAMLDHPTTHELEAVALHPVGHLVIAGTLPNEYRQALNLARQSGRDVAGAFEEVLGFSDAHAGAFLLRLWKLDERVVTAIENMDTPWDVSGEPRRASAALWALHMVTGSRSTNPAQDPLPDDIAAMVDAARRYLEEAA